MPKKVPKPEQIVQQFKLRKDIKVEIKLVKIKKLIKNTINNFR
jgi:type III secretory pathway lipoprotein EscJ